MKKKKRRAVRVPRPSPWRPGEAPPVVGKTYEHMMRRDTRGRMRPHWREVTLTRKDVDDDCPMCRMLAGLPPKPLTEYKKPFEIATNLGSLGLGKPGEWDIVRHRGQTVKPEGRRKP